MADTSPTEEKIGLLIWQVSNFWQGRLRNILKNFNLSLNQYLILETLVNIENKTSSLSQSIITTFSGIDESVVSVNLKLLEQNNLIKRKVDNDSRKKIIIILSSGRKIFDAIYPKIYQEEKNIFNKLQDEKLNFYNSLRFILGKKLRIKAEKRI